jgi:hypothetical protein
VTPLAVSARLEQPSAFSLSGESPREQRAQSVRSSHSLTSRFLTRPT